MRGSDRAAEAIAFYRAAELYRFVLDLQTGAIGDEAALRAKLGDALSNAGRGAEAATHFLAAADRLAESPVDRLADRWPGQPHAEEVAETSGRVTCVSGQLEIWRKSRWTGTGTARLVV
ncbi:MAG: hypothetical protein A2V98_20380 [Planctomycetes bacterium RBG_16_64_12]|nr:MAG: hypothetical protein A2V98_20380 [Planctomycetes bacterium RBG_16_64_12]HLA84578.1 hypothetical protein [Thermoguttaceae bacterium]